MTLTATPPARPGVLDTSGDTELSRGRGLRLPDITPWRVAAVLVAIGVLVRATRAFLDVDLYWHVRLGQEILAERTVHGLAQAWSFGAPPADWVTTQWLSEVVLAVVHEATGWQGIALVKLLLAALFVGGLLVVVLRGRHTPWAAAVFAVTALIGSDSFQERPQLFSLPLLVWVAAWSWRLVQGGRGPAVWSVFVVTALWANLHGLWVMVPAVLLLIAAGRLVTWLQDRAAADPHRPLLLLTAAVAGVSCTPVGPVLLLAPVRFSGATRYITEWQPTAFDNYLALSFGVLVAALVLAWARSPQIPVVELVVAGGLVAFAMLALRNVIPAAVLLAPLVASRLGTAFPRRDAVHSAREAASLVLVGSTAALAGTVGIAFLALTGPLVPNTVPVGLASRLVEEPGDHRVLNEYDTGGALLLYGGAGTRVAVDGRADRYGADYIGRYQQTLAAAGDWRRELDRLDPDWALLQPHRPIVERLREVGWEEVDRDASYVLLRRGDA